MYIEDALAEFREISKFSSSNQNRFLKIITKIITNENENFEISRKST